NSPGDLSVNHLKEPCSIVPEFQATSLKHSFRAHHQGLVARHGGRKCEQAFQTEHGKQRFSNVFRRGRPDRFTNGGGLDGAVLVASPISREFLSAGFQEVLLRHLGEVHYLLEDHAHEHGGEGTRRGESTSGHQWGTEQGPYLELGYQRS